MVSGSGVTNNIPVSQEIFVGTEEERLSVAEKYKVAKPELLQFKDGQWLMSNIPIKEWDELFNEKDKNW